MKQWRASREAGDTAHLGPGVQYSLETIEMFIAAYLAVVGNDLMSPESHDVFVHVFSLGGMQKSSTKHAASRAEFFRLLVVTCRKEKDWKPLETRDVLIIALLPISLARVTGASIPEICICTAKSLLTRRYLFAMHMCKAWESA